MELHKLAVTCAHFWSINMTALLRPYLISGMSLEAAMESKSMSATPAKSWTLSPWRTLICGQRQSKGRQNVKFSWIWIALLPPEKRSFCPQELWKSFGNNTEHSPHSRSQHLLHASGGLLVDYFLGINDCLDCFSTQGWLPDSGLACRVCFFADSGSFAACPMQHMRSAPLPGQITGPSFACQTRTAKTFLASPPGPIPRQTWILPTEIWLQARGWMWQSYLHHPGRDGPGKSGTATIFLDVFQRLSWASAAKAACFLDSGPWLFLALDDYAPRHHEG